jgi:hypothetical protein
MTIEEGEKVHIASRRLFPTDIKRHFAGRVEAVEGDSMRVTGHAFIYHSETRKFEKKPNVRTRVFSLIDARLVINILPKDADVGQIKYVVKDARLALEISEAIEYDLTEYMLD